MATDRLAFWAVSTAQRLHMQQLRLLPTKTNADNKRQADDSSCSHYAAEVLGESKKQASLALGNFGALGVMDALCAVMSARVRGM